MRTASEGCSNGVLAGVSLAALFINLPEKFVELRPLFGRQDLAHLFAPLRAHLIKLRIHLLADGVIANLHTSEYVANLRLLVRREVQIVSKPIHDAVIPGG